VSQKADEKHKYNLIKRKTMNAVRDKNIKTKKPHMKCWVCHCRWEIVLAHTEILWRVIG